MPDSHASQATSLADNEICVIRSVFTVPKLFFQCKFSKISLKNNLPHPIYSIFCEKSAVMMLSSDSRK